MPDSPVLISPQHSPTLRRMVQNIAVIDAHLDHADAWRGADIADQYVRIEAVDSLLIEGREHSVAMHIFARAVTGDLHNHRWPFAVYPFVAGVPDGTPLYEMPWQHGEQSGVVTVCSRYPYAIEECAVQHAVRGLRPHMSLTVADIAEPPTRPNRLALAPLTANVTEIVLAYVRDAFRQSHGSLSR